MDCDEATEETTASKMSCGNVECSASSLFSVPTLKMYDMTGRIVLQDALRSPLSTFNFQLAAGIYLVRVEAADKVWQQKLVVE